MSQMSVPPKVPKPAVLDISHSSITFKWNCPDSPLESRTSQSTNDQLSRKECVTERGEAAIDPVSDSASSRKTIFPLVEYSDEVKRSGFIYTLQMENQITKNWTNVYRGFADKYVVDDLESNTAYKFRINAANDVGAGPWSDEIEAATGSEPMLCQDLHKMIRVNDIEGVTDFLSRGRNRIDAPNKMGRTALMEACLKDGERIAELLIDSGADIEYVTEGGKTCLYMVCYAGKLNMAEMLRHHGARLDTKDATGCSILHAAADGGHSDVAEWGLKHGLSVDVVDKFNGWTPLHRTAAVSGSVEVAKVLIKYGAVVDAKDNTGKTSLMIAVCNNHLALVEELVKNGADTSYQTEHGKTAYDMAVALGRKSIVKSLQP